MAWAAGFAGIPWKDDAFEAGVGMGLVETKEGERCAGEDKESRPSIAVSTAISAAATTGEHSGIYSLAGLFLLNTVGLSPRPIPCNLCRLTPHGDGGKSATSEDGAAVLYGENAGNRGGAVAGMANVGLEAEVGRVVEDVVVEEARAADGDLVKRRPPAPRRRGATGRRSATAARMERHLRITANN